MGWKPANLGLILVSLLAFGSIAWAAVPRIGTPTGVVVTANGDETIQFVAEATWRNVEVEQDLLVGDKLRTGPSGGLALRFIDQTLIRVSRNSELVVKKIGGGTQASTDLDLNLGQIWARALGGGSGVNVSTPSATAAIRGTDWSMAVEGSGKTTLVVLDGIVSLSNEFGAVEVGANEAAIAEIGKAPSKILLAQPPGREQMLYYLEGRSLFAWLPISDLSSSEERARRAELSSRPLDALGAEEQVERAELAFHYEGVPAMQAALAPLRDSASLTPDLEHRIALLDGLAAALARDWETAGERLSFADEGLTGRRLLSALTGQYLALILSGQAEAARAKLAEIDSLPRDAYHALIHAWIAALTGDIEGARRILNEGQQEFPEEVMLPAMESQLAITMGDEQTARDAVVRGEAIDPDNPFLLFAKATVLEDFDYELDAARKIHEHTIEIAPGHTATWNSLGLLLDDEEDFAGAQAAHERAIAIDPYDANLHSNYALFLVVHHRLDEAKAQIDQAKALDPGYYATSLVEGLWYIESGQDEGARNAYLSSVAANPAVSESSLGLAIAYYQNGETDAAMQALEDADRLDPNDPVVPLVRTVIALNQSEAGVAIRSARESYRRYLRQGKLSSPIAAAQGAGSYLFDAFDNLSLSEWGRAYGDLSFNPFDSSAQFYQASAPVIDPVINGDDDPTTNFNSILQGLAIDPLAVSGRSRYIDLVRRPFFDPVVGGGGVFPQHDPGWNTNINVSGYVNEGMPLSLFGSLSYDDNDQDSENIFNEQFIGSVFMGTEFDPNNRLFFFGQGQNFEDALPKDATFLGEDQDFDATTYDSAIGFSHRFGSDNVLLALAGVTGIKQDVDTHFESEGVPVDIETKAKRDGVYGALAHYVGIGDVTLRYGVEGESDEGDQSLLAEIDGDEQLDFFVDDDILSGRLYADASWEITPRVTVEGGFYVSYFDEDGSDPETHIDPRIGASLLFLEGHYLRAAYREDTNLPITGSLAPVATVGLIPASTHTDEGGDTHTLAFRWDAEWSEHFFTALEYQHQEIADYSVSWLDDAFLRLFSVGNLNVERGDLDLLSLSANTWVLEDVGLFANGTLIDSDNETGPGDLPLIPDWTASFGVTWVSPIDLRVSVTENLVGPREGDLSGENELSSFATTDIAVTWQPYDRHIQLSAGIDNLFDEDYHIAHGVQAPGRVFFINGEIRF